MTIPTLRGPGELLGTLPAFLGFTPIESVVIVGIRAGGELGSIMRVDRADCLVPEVVDSMSRAVTAHLARDRAVAVILVSYTASDARVSCEAADALRRVVDESVSRVDTWVVTNGRYFAPGCADVTCCPANGTAVPELPAEVRDEIEDSAFIVCTGHASGRKTWGGAPALERRRCARAADRWHDKRPPDADMWRRLSFERWETYLTDGSEGEFHIAEAELGKLIAGLSDVRVRDAVIVWLGRGSAQAVDDVLTGTASSEVSLVLAALLDPIEYPVVDDYRAAALRGVIVQCVPNCRRKDAAPLLAVLALVEWWSGNANLALSLCESAMDSIPGYRLAELVWATILADVVPLGPR